MDIKWTDERAKQLELLEGLLMDLEMLDRGSNFLSNTQECIETATSLRKLDLDKCEESFLGFLKGLCRTERIEKIAIDNVHKASVPDHKIIDEPTSDVKCRPIAKEDIMMNTAVTLIPTRDRHQFNKEGIVVGGTRTQWEVLCEDGARIEFYKQDGMPVSLTDRKFPCYKLDLKSIQP